MMTKYLQRYSICIVLVMVTLYSVFAEIKNATEYPYFRPFNGYYMITLLIPLGITYILERNYETKIDVSRYTRFIISLIMIGLIIMTMSGIGEHFSNVFSSINLLIDYTLGVLLIFLVIISITLENLSYKDDIFSFKEFTNELLTQLILSMSVFTLITVAIVAVVIHGVMGLRV